MLLGLDQVLVRHTPATLKIVRRAVSNSAVMSALLLLALLAISEASALIYVTLSIFLLSLVTLQYAIFRGHNFKLQAQLAVNGWKVIVTVLVITLWHFEYKVNFPLITTASCFIALVLLAFFNIRVLTAIFKCTDYQNSYEKSYTILGGQFLLAMLTLSLSIYLEQILLNSYGFTISSAQYFAHAAIILPPIVFLNGYLGFILGPFVRQNPKRSSELYFYSLFRVMFL